MILFLALQMGQEYLHVRNYDMAKRFFERIISNYQKEQWWPVLAQVQRALRECAQQLQLLPDFVSCSVALLAKDLSDAAAAAAALQQLLALVRLGNPASTSAASPFLPLSSPMELQIEPAQKLLRCRAAFSSAQLPLGGRATLRLRLLSSLAVPLPLTELQICSTDGALSRTLLSPDAAGAADVYMAGSVTAAAAGTPGSNILALARPLLLTLTEQNRNRNSTPNIQHPTPTRQQHRARGGGGTAGVARRWRAGGGGELRAASSRRHHAAAGTVLVLVVVCTC